MMTSPMLTLTSHPRLHVTARAWSELDGLRNEPFFAMLMRELEPMAQAALDVQKTAAGFSTHGHNCHLIRARQTQCAVSNLIVQYRLSGDYRYKAAVMDHVQMMHDWEYWSWITWRQNNNDPAAIFDLSYGENSTTLAIIHDWLKADLTQEDTALILATSQRPVSALLRYFTPDDQGKTPELPWWFKHAQSNWNTVCAGGAGMLALSLYELLPEAPRILELCEASITPYMKQLEVLNGAWPEGIGYWNYGMRYAFTYLLAHENATGRRHWALDQPATRQSLYFPMDFCPNGVPCSFGDVNQWAPLPFHHAVARRTGADDLEGELMRTALSQPSEQRHHGSWPYHADALLLIRPPKVAPEVSPQATSHVAPSASGESPGPGPGVGYVKLYEGQDWGIVADRATRPDLYLAVRGGTTEVPHGHQDLTSFHAVLKNESLLFNQGVNQYLDTTFSPRRGELYDTTPASKNVLLVNGLGITAKSTVVTRRIQLAPDVAGLHIDAGEAMGVMRDGPAVAAYQRVFLLIASKALLILDHLQANYESRCESRLHTLMTPDFHEHSVGLQGEQQQAAIHLACSVPATLYPAMSLSTSPLAKPVHVIRWISNDLHKHFAFATLITPGQGKADVNILANDTGVKVDLTFAGGPRTLSLSSNLASLQGPG